MTDGGMGWGEWFGQKLFEILKGWFGAFRKSRKQITQRDTESVVLQISEEKMLDCYRRLLDTTELRLYSFGVLEAIGSSHRPMPEDEILKRAQALVGGNASSDGLSKALKDLHYGDLVQPSGVQYWELRPNGQAMVHDYFNWTVERKLLSSEDQQLRCFIGLLLFLGNSNSFPYILQVLSIAQHSLSASEIHARSEPLVRGPKGRKISLQGVKNLLRGLARSGFVEEQDEKFEITELGRFLRYCIQKRFDIREQYPRVPNISTR